MFDEEKKDFSSFWQTAKIHERALALIALVTIVLGFWATVAAVVIRVFW